MAEEQENLVEIQDEEGNVTKCEVYDVVDFEGKSYALLYPVVEGNEEDGELIVLEYIEEGDDCCYFQNIEDEEEFEKVCEYIQSLEYDDEEE